MVPALVSNKAWVRHPSPPSHTYVHSAICKKQIRIHMHIACPHLSLVRTCHLLVRTCHLSAPVTCPHLSLESAPVTYVRTCQCHHITRQTVICHLDEGARFRNMLTFGRLRLLAFGRCSFLEGNPHLSAPVTCPHLSLVRCRLFAPVTVRTCHQTD